MGRLQHLSLLSSKRNLSLGHQPLLKLFKPWRWPCAPLQSSPFLISQRPCVGMWCLRERNWCCPYARGSIFGLYQQQLSEINLGKSIYEKEMLDILHAVDLWGPYLLGQWFQIKTNHQSLKYFLEQRISSPEQQKWVTKLFGYDYEIIYKKEKTMWLRCTFQKYEDEGSLFFSFIHCTILAPSCSPGMATRSQKFAVDPAIIVQCSSFPRVLLSPWGTLIQRLFVFN